MSILRFTDGTEFDTSGPLRKEEREDGWYVMGEGKLIPTSSEEESNRVIGIHGGCARCGNSKMVEDPDNGVEECGDC